MIYVYKYETYMYIFKNWTNVNTYTCIMISMIIINVYIVATE